MSFSNKIKTFEASIRPSLSDKNKTLAAWQERAILTRDAYMQIKAEHDKEVAELEKTYTPEALKSRVDPLNAEMKEIERFAKKMIGDDLDRTMAEKRQQLEKCLESPSEEAVRLLQVMSLRTDLTQREIEAALPRLNDNIHAMRLLRDIATRAGLYCPDAGNVEKIEDGLAKAEGFCRSMINSMSDGDLRYRAYAFWTHPLTADMSYYHKLIDNEFYSSAQIREAKEIQDKETAQSKKDQAAGKEMNAAKVFLRGDESLAGIAMQFGVSTNAIRKANPGIELDDLSQYSPGTSIVVPSGKFTMKSTPGSVIPDQVIAIHYTPEQSSTHIPDGTEINVNNI